MTTPTADWRRSLVDACRRHPLTRALRIDKLTLAALEAPLKPYLDPGKALARIPTLRALAATRDDLRPVAARLAAAVRRALPDAVVDIRDGFSRAGGGSLPGVEIPTVLVAVQPVEPVHKLEAQLRRHDPPVMVRVHNGELLLDPRALWPDDIDVIASALQPANGARDLRCVCHGRPAHHGPQHRQLSPREAPGTDPELQGLCGIGIF